MKGWMKTVRRGHRNFRQCRVGVVIPPAISERDCLSIVPNDRENGTRKVYEQEEGYIMADNVSIMS